MARELRGVLAALVAFSALAGQAHAERVIWRATGVITNVRSAASSLPFLPAVGQRMTLDMDIENNSANVTGQPLFAGPGTASYDNIFGAELTIGTNVMVLAPTVPWATTLWNDVVIGSNVYDYYSMPIVDGPTQWEARWAVQEQFASGSGPMTSMDLLTQPPRVKDFTTRTFTLNPFNGPVNTPAVEARLDSVTVVGPDTPVPGEGSGGGGAAGLMELLALLGCTTAACHWRRRGARRA
jgi:hypothetical protein